VLSWGGPYVNTFGWEECPWRSKNNLSFLGYFLLKFLIRLNIPISSGNSFYFFIISYKFQFRFKSCPNKFVRLLPMITPSMFNIGIITHWIDFEKLFLIKRLINPSIIHEPTVSPGCCRAIINATILHSFD
jgi:hypothetical protein